MRCSLHSMLKTFVLIFYYTAAESVNDGGACLYLSGGICEYLHFCANVLCIL